MKARKNCTRNEHHDEEKGSVVPQASGMGLILANPLNYTLYHDGYNKLDF
jgi:hypothetical protein